MGFYAVGRLLIAMSKRAPIMAIVAIMAAVEIAKYISVGGKATSGYGGVFPCFREYSLNVICAGGLRGVGDIVGADWVTVWHVKKY